MPIVTPTFLLNTAAASSASSTTVAVTGFSQTIPRGAVVAVFAGAGVAGAVTVSSVADDSSQGDGDANTWLNRANNSNAQTDVVSSFSSLLTRSILTSDTITATFSGSLTRKAIHAVAFLNASHVAEIQGTANNTASPMTISLGVNGRTGLQVSGTLLATGTPTTGGYADPTTGFTALAGVNTAQATVNVELDCSYRIISTANPTNNDAPTATNIVSATALSHIFRALVIPDEVTPSRMLRPFTRFG